MRKMIGIIMMTVGVILLVSGYFVYGNRESDLIKDEIEGQIQAVIADGVFTNKEKTHIGKLADKYKMDKEEIYAEINKQLESIDGDAETEIIDQYKKKANDFEKFIVKKFNKEHFIIKQWAGDKYVDGIYSEKTLQPDLIVEFNYRDYKKLVAVECKWRKDYYLGSIEFTYDDQLARYKQFEKNEKTEVYIAIGIGGKASAPKELYLIPLIELNQTSISRSQIKKFEKKVNDDFNFNMETAKLDIATSLRLR